MSHEMSEELKRQLEARKARPTTASGDLAPGWKKTKRGAYIREADSAVLETLGSSWLVSIPVRGRSRYGGTTLTPRDAMEAADAAYPGGDPTRLRVLERLDYVANTLQDAPLRFYRGFYDPFAVVLERDAPTPSSPRSPGQRPINRASEYLLAEMQGKPSLRQLEFLLFAAVIAAHGGLRKGGDFFHGRHEAVLWWLLERTGPAPWSPACTGSPLPLVDFRSEVWSDYETTPPLATCLTAALLSRARLAQCDILVYDGGEVLPERPAVVHPVRSV